jgi:hypothetical protein
MCRLLLNCQVKARPNSCGRGPLGIAYHDSVLEDPLLIYIGVCFPAQTW